MENIPSILFADDEPGIRAMVKLVLERAGLRVTLAENGLEALRLCQENGFDLVLMDVMMPLMNGFEATRRIRQFSDVPVVFLTVKAEEEDLIYGFHVGAHDYLTKPFRPKELVIRIQSILKRTTSQRNTNGRLLRYKDLELDPQTRQVFKGGKAIDITPVGFQLLVYLMQHPGEIVTKADLLKEVWAYPDPSGGENMVEAAIKRLRRDLGDDSREPRYIRTIWGCGYRFGENKNGLPG